MKTANILVYGNISVYIKYCSVSSPLGRHLIGLLMVNTMTHVL